MHILDLNLIQTCLFHCHYSHQQGVAVGGSMLLFPFSFINGVILIVNSWIDEVAVALDKMWRFVLAFKSHWWIAESGSNSFNSRLVSLTLKRLLNVSCCVLVFSTVFSWFMAENDLSHVAVVCEMVIISLTNTRICKSSGLRANKDAYTSVGFNALWVAKKLFSSCHSFTAPSLSSWERWSTSLFTSALP